MSDRINTDEAIALIAKRTGVNLTEEKCRHGEERETISLLARKLGIDLEAARREEAEAAEAARQEAERKKAEAGAVREAANLEARRKKFADNLKQGLIRAWRSDPKKGLVEVRGAADLVCPKCGEQPDAVQNLIDRLAGDLTTRSRHDRSMGLAPYFRETQAFRVNVACKCGTRAEYAAVYLPETTVE
ncbi:MAG: hypothetical protein WC277_03920 [Bacilli bacterium]